MYRILQIILIGSLLASCADNGNKDSNLSGEPNPDNTQSPAEFTLEPIGDKEVVFDQPLQINLTTSAVDGFSVSFSTDGTAGPDANPYAVADNPATFDETTGQFNWTPGASHAGGYSVRFIATTDETEPRSASESINITVWSEGRKLFEENCAVCHGFDASGASGSNNRNIQGESAATIQAAIDLNVSAMSAFRNQFTSAQIQAIADYLATLVP